MRGRLPAGDWSRYSASWGVPEVFKPELRMQVLGPAQGWAGLVLCLPTHYCIGGPQTGASGAGLEA